MNTVSLTVPLSRRAHRPTASRGLGVVGALLVIFGLMKTLVTEIISFNLSIINYYVKYGELNSIQNLKVWWMKTDSDEEYMK